MRPDLQYWYSKRYNILAPRFPIHAPELRAQGAACTCLPLTLRDHQVATLPPIQFVCGAVVSCAHATHQPLSSAREMV
jgi:hypothetical protein